MQQLVEEALFGEDENPTPILKYFEENIQGYVEGIKKQAEKEITLASENVSSTSKRFGLFLERAAQNVKKEIEVRFYSKPDNLLAFTHRGTNQMFVNECGLVLPFKKMEEDYQVCGEIKEKHFGKIVKMLETLSHEWTHMVEESDCKSTHDPAFNARVADRLEKFFILDGQAENSPLALLEEIFKTCAS